MTITTVSGTIDIRYLMGKTKRDLAYMYMELLRDYNKELERNTPRPEYGIKIVVDKNLRRDEIRVVDELDRPLGKVEL